MGRASFPLSFSLLEMKSVSGTKLRGPFLVLLYTFSEGFLSLGFNGLFYFTSSLMPDLQAQPCTVAYYSFRKIFPVNHVFDG